MKDQVGCRHGCGKVLEFEIKRVYSSKVEIEIKNRNDFEFKENHRGKGIEILCKECKKATASITCEEIKD